MIPDLEARGLIMGADGRARPQWAHGSNLMRAYYDTEWGAVITDEQSIFERLVLESFQAGLSWEIVLKKRAAFRRAFKDFDPEKVAHFGAKDIERMAADTDIIRNTRKISAAITNARATLALRAHDEGDLAHLVWSYAPQPRPRPQNAADIPTNSPESRALSSALKKHGFVFIGPTTIYSFMQAIGMVDDRISGAADLIPTEKSD
ncbi:MULTISPECIES: DNA-3-methyladenine glycosylase I [unclassified Corynebacterium]|uniref:DNA-3-methyladenine glycosylase I n=1 Tax=unclassified Corynebacterium TaxID=2624378 RepID=UPI00286F5E09|nr:MULTISPECIES: DNA-3-methyladenine glycosylase I [unclassified Corynebacterium]